MKLNIFKNFSSLYHLHNIDRVSGFEGFKIGIFFIKIDPNKDKFYKIYHFNFISQKLSVATQGASNFKIEILYVKLKVYKTPLFRAMQT